MTETYEEQAHEGGDEPRSLRDPSLFVNRELSWLQFNDRVLQLAEDDTLPLLERLKFLAIFVSNLDEFFMIRVAGVNEQVDARIDARGPDGLSPSEVLQEIHDTVREQDRRHARQFSQVIRPGLAEQGIRITTCRESGASPETIASHFREQIFPVLTPLAVGAGRPFPYISNLSLSLIVRLHDPDNDHEAYARVKVPKEVLPRFVEIEKDTFVTLEDIIAEHLDALFPGMEIISHDLFRVTRDADFEVSDEADDLLRAIENELRRRRFGEVIRLEVGATMDPALRTSLIDWLGVDEVQVYDVEGLLDQSDLFQIAGAKDRPDLSWPSWNPVPLIGPTMPAQSEDGLDLFKLMRAGDVLVHYPYQSFTASVERFVSQAVDDPNVLAIKMTVYRTSDDSSLVPSLIAAAEKGKQAVCMVELKARFDERRNIHWSRALEEAGAHVVHGIPGLKTHAKAILIVRRERNGVRNYVMIGTGNFHAKNARLYEDWGFFTADHELGEEVANLFNTLTGYGHPAPPKETLVAPTWMRKPLLEQIEETARAFAEGDHDARITMKMNSLVDPKMIEGLYRAAQTGVPIALNVRGICCLVPGLPGISESISVVSVVGRFLEHSRIYSFHRHGESRYYIGSADLMPRNLDTRVELLTPIKAPELQSELADTLERCLADDTYAWTMDAERHWTRRTGRTRSVHNELMERTLQLDQGSAPSK
jgi:polyphosphate kinase